MELIGSSRVSKVMDRITRASALVADEHETGTQELEHVAREIAALEGWVQNASEFRPLAAFFARCQESCIQHRKGVRRHTRCS